MKIISMQLSFLTYETNLVNTTFRKLSNILPALTNKIVYTWFDKIPKYNETIRLLK